MTTTNLKSNEASLTKAQLIIRTLVLAASVIIFLPVAKVILLVVPIVGFLPDAELLITGSMIITLAFLLRLI